jgi:urea transport system ATP-binding protein
MELAKLLNSAARHLLDDGRRARHGVRRRARGDTGRVTVMAEGAVLAEGTLDQVKRDDAVIESYLGR